MSVGFKLIDSKCKFCQKSLEHRFVDIIVHEHVSQASIGITDQGHDQGFLVPTYVCASCFLVQVDEPCLPPDLERAYVSSFGSSWLTDIKKFTDNIFESLDTTDGKLTATLIDRNHDTRKGVKDKVFNFGTNGLLGLIDMYGKADTIICHDELAHVYDANDFVAGLKLFLKTEGVISMEFLHLLAILEGSLIKSSDEACFPYLSLSTTDKILRKHGLVIFDVGSNPSQDCLRILIKHIADSTRHISSSVMTLRGKERDLGMSSMQCYNSFKDRSRNLIPVKKELYFISK